MLKLCGCCSSTGADIKEQKNSEYDEVEPKAKVEAVQVLLEHDADLTARDGTHSTPLHLASSKRSPKLARLLIERGADINAMDRKRKTPLHLASSLVSFETV